MLATVISGASASAQRLAVGDTTRWKRYGSAGIGRSRSVFDLDLSSFTLQGDKIVFVVRRTYSIPRRLDNGQAYVREVVRYRVDCASASFSFDVRAFVDRTDSVIQLDGVPASWTPVTVGPMGDTLVAIVCSSSTSRPPPATTNQRWIVVGTSNDSIGGYTASLDRETITRAGSTVTVWISFAFDQPRHTKDGEEFVRELEREEIDCPGHQIRGLNTALYGRGDHVLRDVNTPDAAWEPDLPASVGEIIEHYACRR